MRLWHYKLIPFLSRERLVRQHCECCALRGKSWGKKHSTVDFAFKYDPSYLVVYHFYVMHEMNERGYKTDVRWWSPSWRGNNCHGILCATIKKEAYKEHFAEHNDEQLLSDIERLKQKGEVIDINEVNKYWENK